MLMDIMPDTFGVMVYQEDVIKVAHYFGGLTLGEADPDVLQGTFRQLPAVQHEETRLAGYRIYSPYPLRKPQPADFLAEIQFVPLLASRCPSRLNPPDVVRHEPSTYTGQARM